MARRDRARAEARILRGDAGAVHLDERVAGLRPPEEPGEQLAAEPRAAPEELLASLVALDLRLVAHVGVGRHPVHAEVAARERRLLPRLLTPPHGAPPRARGRAAPRSG